MILTKAYPIRDVQTFWKTQDERYCYGRATQIMNERAWTIKDHKYISEHSVPHIGFPKCHARDCVASCFGWPVRRLCQDHGRILNHINVLYHEARTRIDLVTKEIVDEVRPRERPYDIIRAMVGELHGLGAIEISMRNVLAQHYGTADRGHRIQLEQCQLAFVFYTFLLSPDGEEYMTKPWRCFDDRKKHWMELETQIPIWEKAKDTAELHIIIKQYLNDG